MKYENIKIEIINLSSSDVIATSKEVTTGAIVMPWQTDANVSEASFNLMSITDTSGYDV